MTKIQWGIIGCGDVTEIKSGPAFNKVPDSNLIAVMRRNKEKAEDYAKRHGVPKYYDNAKQLIDDPDVNAIYIATPPLYHEEYTIQSLEAGKPVYVEKPMSLNQNGAIKMLEKSRSTGSKLAVAHYRREQPLFKKIKLFIDQHQLGEIRLVNLMLIQPPQTSIVAKTEEAWRLIPKISGGGLFHDLAPHQLDLLLYFFGFPRYMKGISRNQAGLYGADDFVAGIFEFEKGVVCNASWSFTAAKEAETDRIEIIGSEGKIVFSVFRNNGIMIFKNGKEDLIEFEPIPHVQQPMIEQVVQYFLGERTNPCSPEEGVETMRMMDALTNHSENL